MAFDVGDRVAIFVQNPRHGLLVTDGTLRRYIQDGRLAVVHVRRMETSPAGPWPRDYMVTLDARGLMRPGEFN